VEGIKLWDGYEGGNIYLNNINIKFCNVENSLIKRKEIYKENELLTQYEEVLTKNIDERMTDWFECMKIMKGNANKCYEVMF
jgi:hypothetical protein